ncbi:MAG: AzlC family ABC transporter permease [Pseudomonadota bacterium]
MTPPPLRHRYVQGALAGLPFTIVVGPFALIFGVLATEAGLDLAQTMGMSLLIIAGAAQFAAVQLLDEAAPVWVILATALAINMRMAMYSASMAPHLGRAPLWQRMAAAYFLFDQAYGVSIRRFDDAQEWSVAEKMAFFFGCVLPICPLWYAGTYVGAVAGAAIPPEYALDFAVPITFLALIAPYLRTLPHIAAALVSVTLSLALVSLPPGTGIIVAGVAGMLAGALVEAWCDDA